MSAEDDIDRFIQEQKIKIARERVDLGQANNSNQFSEPVRNGYHQNGDASLKENLPPRAARQQDRSQPNTEEEGLPLGRHDTLQDRLKKERQQEYKQFVAEKSNRGSSKRNKAEGDGMSLPIGERLSAQERSRAQRNKEYNDFLKQKGGQKRRGPSPDRQGGAPAQSQTNGDPRGPNGYAPQAPNGYDQPQRSNGFNAAPRTQREMTTQTPVPRGYDDPPPRGPRKGWGTPQPHDYEDVLRRKREEESRYRRNDDLDYYQPRLRPAHSDPYINRYDDDGRRSSRREYFDDYDRRRVRFSDEVPPAGPPGGPRGGEYTDRSYRPRQREPLEEPLAYDWGVSKAGRSRTFTDVDRPKPALRQEEPDRPPRAKSAGAENTGLQLGGRDTDSATRRKKEQYKKELEQQMKETKAAKIREKEFDRSPGFPSTANRPAAAQEGTGRQSRNQGQSGAPGSQGQQPPPQGYTPSFANQLYGTRSQSNPTTPFPGQYAPQAQAYGPGFAQQGRPPPSSQPLGDLGLRDALAKSKPELLDRPFSLNYPPPSSLQTPGANNTDPYLYYGVRNPLEPDPNPSVAHGLPHPTAATATTMVPPSSNLTSPLLERYMLLQQQQQQLLQQQQRIAQQTKQLEQQLPPTGPGQGNVQFSQQPIVSKQTAAQLRGDSSIKNFIGDSNLSPRSQLTGASYREQLLLQMQEKEAKKAASNAEKAAYEAKLDRDIDTYDPWGKGGAGAPMRDKQGKIVADLKKLHDRNETLLNDPRRKDLQLYAGTGAGPPANPAAGRGPGQEVSPLLAAAAAASAGPGGPGPGVGGGLGGVAPGPTYGRIKGAITGETSNPAADASRNEYQEELKRQVEEKKRREAEEKEKIRLEEEKEEKRLEAQRERIKKEYEKEIERKKQKEEAARKQKEDLERQLEDKRKEAENKKKEANEKRRREADDNLRHRDLDYNVGNLSQRVSSPPIPTLRTKEPERVASPPIPTLRKDGGGRSNQPPEQPPPRRSVESPPIPTHQSKEKKSKAPGPGPEAQDDDFPSGSGRTSPPVPAVTTRERGGPKDEKHVMGALSAMRMQLAHEQQRVQSQLDKNRDYDPYNPLPKAAHAPRRGSPQVDVFELARHKGSVAVLIFLKSL